MTGKYPRLNCRFPRRSGIKTRADISILSLAILAHNNHINILRLHTGKGTRRATQKTDRAQIDIFIEPTANLQEKTTE